MVLYYNGHLIDEHEHKCLCCQEVVGDEDSRAIVEQLKNREKNCMWCGYDFDIAEEDILHRLEDEGAINEIAARLNNARLSDQDDSFANMIFDIEVQREDGYPIISASVKKKDFEKEKKDVIFERFGIDTDKERFDPGYADKDGNPRDRIEDAVEYEEIRRDDLPHKILQFVEKNPGCTGSDIKKRVRFSRTSRIRDLPNHPVSRLYASKLIDCTSKFTGLVDMSAVAARMPSGYFGKMPRFSRKYTITAHGRGVLTMLDMKRKEVLL